MGSQVAGAVAAVALASFAGAAPEAPPRTAVTIVFAGDVMLGRGVARLAHQDGPGVFDGVRFELGSADLAVANLESPLTHRSHLASRGPNALEADPADAALLQRAGLDAMAIANNHAGDAGPQTVADTTDALTAAHVVTLGTSLTPSVLVVHGVRIAFLSVDATGEGPTMVARWNASRVRDAVDRARDEADVVVVGVHGGTEYRPSPDPSQLRIDRLLAQWGADVVWGTGPHVVQPMRVVRGARPAVVAPSLGNLVFDQHLPGTREGALLEVMVGAGGVRAYRVGTTRQEPSDAVDFGAWLQPRGDAAAVGGDWWTLTRTPALVRTARPAPKRFPWQVTSAAAGDVEANGTKQLAVSFWRPYRATDVNALIPRRLLVDRRGLTAHVGLFRARDRRELWVAGTVLQPVVKLAACDGALAVAYSSLNGSRVIGAGAWRWRGFGFSQLPDLAGAGTPACGDVDGDGTLDPVILR